MAKPTSVVPDATPRPRRFRPDAPARSVFQGLPAYARLVLDIVDSIPTGNVMAYGDIAEYIDQGTARLVARVMSSYGGDEVPWWRVLRADGTCAPEVAERQIDLLENDGVAWRVPRHRVDMTAARWTPADGPEASRSGKPDDSN